MYRKLTLANRSTCRQLLNCPQAYWFLVHRLVQYVDKTQNISVTIIEILSHKWHN